MRGALDLGVVLALDQLLLGRGGDADAGRAGELGCVDGTSRRRALVDAGELAAGGRAQPREHLALGLSVARALGEQAGLLHAPPRPARPTRRAATRRPASAARARRSPRAMRSISARVISRPERCPLIAATTPIEARRAKIGPPPRKQLSPDRDAPQRKSSTPTRRTAVGASSAASRVCLPTYRHRRPYTRSASRAAKPNTASEPIVHHAGRATARVQPPPLSALVTVSPRTSTPVMPRRQPQSHKNRHGGAAGHGSQGRPSSR